MKAIILGAGIGGIAAAIRCAQLGYTVEILERNALPGGKLSMFTLGDFRFDRGPSLFTMPQYVDELFELCGEDAREHFNYRKEDIVCRYFWENGQELIAYADPERFSAEASLRFGVPVDQVAEALAKSLEKYQLSGKTFLEKPLHKAATWISSSVLKTLTKLGKMDLMRSMHEVNSRDLSHPKLIQLFDRFATYNGSNPYRAPGILTIIPSYEHIFGTYLPEGGMYEITEKLVQLAERQGVKFSYNQNVTDITSANGRIQSVRTSCGAVHSCDLLVSNSDIFNFYQHLMPHAKKPQRTLAQERSTSALIFYWGIKGSFEQLGLHNIFFSTSYKDEFEALHKGEISDDFTIYVNITSKSVVGEAPDGCENWFVMINAPADTGQDWEKTLSRIKKVTLDKLSKQLGVPLADYILVESSWTPPGIARDTGSDRGALYGSSSNSRMAAFLRHRNQSSEFKNLFFVGGTVHPGGGVPLALLSAKIASGLMPAAS